MQVMRNKYTLDDAKDHVAKQVFRYFGYSDVTVDDEETQEDAFRAMRSWNASATGWFCKQAKRLEIPFFDPNTNIPPNTTF